MKELQTFKGQTYEANYLGKIDISKLSPLWQVYGFFFDEKNNLLINDDGKGNWRLPGGHIEKNEHWKQTIVREVLEEADIILEENSINLFGVIEMTPKSQNCEKPHHYLLRVSGKIKKVNKQTPDPDSGLVCQRKLINPKDFSKYINWGKFGEKIKGDAIKSINKKTKSVGGIIFHNNKVLIVKKSKKYGGHWDFPKGSIKRDETDEIKTLKREIKEETNLEIELISNFYEEIHYKYQDNYYNYDKTVGYYLAKPLTFNTHPNDDEIEECLWATEEELREKITFKDSIKVFEKAKDYSK